MANTYTFLTGGTGLLGRYLIRDLLLRGERLALLARGTRRASAQGRLEGILQHWEAELGHSLPRPVLIEGDLRSSELGLSRESRHWIARHCDQIIHSAASLAFEPDGDGEPWNTNYEGTRNVLDLARTAKIRRWHYVSTAYVCGLREGTIYEHELECGQSFRNVYEKSKFEAERMVRSDEGIDELTVYRPAVISGDSQTGYTNTYHGIYLYLRLMALVVPRQQIGPDGKRMTRLRLPMTGDERRNVIPVDWVSRAMTQLFLSPEAHGRTYHLAPETCITPREIIEAAYRYFHSSGVEYVGYQKLDPDTYNDFEREFLPGVTMYNDYERTDPLFDCSNLKRFAGHIACPPIDDAMLHRYLRFGEEDRWGKRRERPAQYDSRLGELLQSRVPGEVPSRSDAMGRYAQERLSLDCTGPGGGQWTIWMRPGGGWSAVPGLDDGAACCEQVNASDLAQTLSSHHGSTSFDEAFSQWLLDRLSERETAPLRRNSAPARLPIQG